MTKSFKEIPLWMRVVGGVWFAAAAAICAYSLITGEPIFTGPVPFN